MADRALHLQRRTEMFMDAFNHISSHIDSIYKELTVKPGHMLGGTAYLTYADIFLISSQCDSVGLRVTWQMVTTVMMRV